MIQEAVLCREGEIIMRPWWEEFTETDWIGVIVFALLLHLVLMAYTEILKFVILPTFWLIVINSIITERDKEQARIRYLEDTFGMSGREIRELIEKEKQELQMKHLERRIKKREDAREREKIRVHLYEEKRKKRKEARMEHYERKRKNDNTK